MRPRLILAALMSFTLWAGVPASTALAQTAPQAGEPDLPKFEQVELTAGDAKRAIDSFIAVREEHGDDPFEGQKVTPEQLKDSETGRQILSVLEDHGFEDPAIWSRTVQSIGFAYGASLDDNLEEARKSLEEVENDESIPDSMKEQMVTMLKSIMPPEGNMEVIETLKADPDYSEKLASIFDESMRE